ncbi:hypothetical protein CPB85DRAFT_1227829 [Mucidula mucida]|nr:hypothetical protein CPB85DRAFT_1227829 [Mucidula mucida]
MRLQYILAPALWQLILAQAAPDEPRLDQRMERLLEDRLFQTNLRGPRWTGNDNQNVLTDSVAASMTIAGLKVDTLKYHIQRWDARWWSLTLNLSNGTSLGLPTTGFWPYSGNSGLEGVTAPVVDAGTYGLAADESGDSGTLDLSALSNAPDGSVMFFDNPSPTRNYSAPGYRLLGTSHNISSDEIPEVCCFHCCVHHNSRRLT